MAIVAGENEACVDKALKMLKVEYEVLPAVLDFHMAKDGDVLVHPEDNWKALCKVGADNKRNLCASDSTEDGDVDAVLADCDEVVEGTYHVRAAQQAMMETFRTTCFMDAYGRLNILSSTQIVYHVRRIISNALGIPNPGSVSVSQGSEEDLVQNSRLWLNYSQHLLHGRPGKRRR